MKNMNKSITIVVDTQKLNEMRKFYSPFIKEIERPYVEFEAIRGDVRVTAFSSKKSSHKIVFFGKEPLSEALKWDETAKEKESKEVVKQGWICFEDQIGSDEVGVGDFLGPMIVVAAFVSKNDIKKLREYKINDSKKMNDSFIMSIGPKLVKEFHFSKLTLSNEKYNEMYEKNENINSLKAKMHNRALLNMHKKYEDVLNIFVDQFVEEKKYYQYLNDENEEQVKGICFKTKGESYFPSVALASVIARYSYLLEMEKLTKKYALSFPFGASEEATKFAKAFVNIYGEKELSKVAKKNFANYREALNK